jgi:hypothetical protein
LLIQPLTMTSFFCRTFCTLPTPVTPELLNS